MIYGDGGGQGVGPSLPIHLFRNVTSKNRRTCEHLSVEVRHLVGKLFAAETLLTEVQYSILRSFACNKCLCSGKDFMLTLYIYTGCPRRNVPDFRRVFLMLKYTAITQKTYVQSWTVTEIMARKNCGLLAGPRTVPVSWQVLSMFILECGVWLRKVSSH